MDNIEINKALQIKINKIKSEEMRSFTEILEKLNNIISRSKNKKLIQDLKEIQKDISKVSGVSLY